MIFYSCAPLNTFSGFENLCVELLIFSDYPCISVDNSLKCSFVQPLLQRAGSRSVLTALMDQCGEGKNDSHRQENDTCTSQRRSPHSLRSSRPLHWTAIPGERNREKDRIVVKSVNANDRLPRYLMFTDKPIKCPRLGTEMQQMDHFACKYMFVPYISLWLRCLGLITY